VDTKTATFVPTEFYPPKEIISVYVSGRSVKAFFSESTDYGLFIFFYF
jgi:hypothetical protein